MVLHRQSDFGPAPWGQGPRPRLGATGTSVRLPTGQFILTGSSLADDATRDHQVDQRRQQDEKVGQGRAGGPSATLRSMNSRRERLVGWWALQWIRDDEQLIPAIANVRAALRVDEGGRVLCFESVNTTNVRYVVDEDGSIQFELTATTLIGGPHLRQDNLLQTALSQAQRYHNGGDSLTLFDASGSTLAVLVPMDSDSERFAELFPSISPRRLRDAADALRSDPHARSELIFDQPNRAAARNALMARFGISGTQAEAILNMDDDFGNFSNVVR